MHTYVPSCKCTCISFTRHALHIRIHIIHTSYRQTYIHTHTHTHQCGALSLGATQADGFSDGDQPTPDETDRQFAATCFTRSNTNVSLLRSSGNVRVFSRELRRCVFSRKLRRCVFSRKLRRCVFSRKLRRCVFSRKLRRCVFSRELRRCVFSRELRRCVFSRKLRRCVFSRELRRCVFSRHQSTCVSTEHHDSIAHIHATIHRGIRTQIHTHEPELRMPAARLTRHLQQKVDAKLSLRTQGGGCRPACCDLRGWILNQEL